MSASLRVIVVVVATVLLAAPTAVSAQDLDTMAVPRVDVSAGYAFMRDVSKRELTGYDHINFPAGWYTSGAFNPTQWFGVVGEVAGNYRNDLTFDVGEMAEAPQLTGLSASNNVHLYTALGGARFFRKVGRVVPFGQVLVGVAHLRVKSFLPMEVGGETITETDNNFAIQPGGGVTLYLTENTGVRLAADYRSMIDFNSTEKNDFYNALRVIGGFTMQWGGR